MKKSFLILSVASMMLASCGGENGNYPEGLPRALRTEPKDGPMPEYVYEADSTTINIIFLGQKPEAGSLLEASLISPADYTEVPAVRIEEDSIITLNVPVLGTSSLSLSLNDFQKRYGDAWIKPGETTNIYIDNRPDSIRGEGRLIYADGTYSNLTAMNAKYPERHVLNYFLAGYNGIGSYLTPGDEYIANVARAYADSLAAINADTVPELAKELWRTAHKAGLVSMLQVEFINRGSWGMTHPGGSRLDPDSVVLAISPENVKALYEIDDLNDSKLAFMPMFNLAVQGVDFAAAGTENNYPADIQAYQKAASKASSGLLSDERLAQIEALDNGEFYGKSLRLLRKGYEQKFAEASKLIKSLPEGTPDDQIIEAIAEPYKGKVVVIDMWNTWCGPCKAAIAANEPVKGTELTDPDIVWVYIADESSPMNLYVNMIPSIKGDHYHLSGEQARALGQRFKVDGIPYYIIVDRKGNIEGRPDLRDHELYKTTIRSKLAEK